MITDLLKKRLSDFYATWRSQRGLWCDSDVIVVSTLLQSSVSRSSEVFQWLFGEEIADTTAVFAPSSIFFICSPASFNRVRFFGGFAAEVMKFPVSVELRRRNDSGLCRLDAIVRSMRVSVSSAKSLFNCPITVGIIDDEMPDSSLLLSCVYGFENYDKYRVSSVNSGFSKLIEGGKKDVVMADDDVKCNRGVKRSIEERFDVLQLDSPKSPSLESETRNESVVFDDHEAKHVALGEGEGEKSAKVNGIDDMILQMLEAFEKDSAQPVVREDETRDKSTRHAEMLRQKREEEERKVLEQSETSLFKSFLRKKEDERKLLEEKTELLRQKRVEEERKLLEQDETLLFKSFLRKEEDERKLLEEKTELLRQKRVEEERKLLEQDETLLFKSFLRKEDEKKLLEEKTELHNSIWGEYSKDLWGGSDVLVIKTPPLGSPATSNHSISSRFFLSLLGREFPNTTAVFMEHALEFICSDESFPTLGSLGAKIASAAQIPVSVQKRFKADDDLELIDKALYDLRTSQDSDCPVIIGYIDGESPKSKVLYCCLANFLDEGRFQAMNVTSVLVKRLNDGAGLESIQEPSSDSASASICTPENNDIENLAENNQHKMSLLNINDAKDATTVSNELQNNELSQDEYENKSVLLESEETKLSSEEVNGNLRTKFSEMNIVVEDGTESKVVTEEGNSSNSEQVALASEEQNHQFGNVENDGTDNPCNQPKESVVSEDEWEIVERNSEEQEPEIATDSNWRSWIGRAFGSL